MNTKVLIKQYDEPPICESEILRYANCNEGNEETLMLLRSCLEEARKVLSYKICFSELPVKIKNNTCDLGFLSVQSENLSKNLRNCQSVILFCATIGLELDRLISKYSRLSPSRALLFHAIGAERIESLCDIFCKEISSERKLLSRPRFSPGYGDIPLETQKDILSFLQTHSNIAVFLNESMLMSPTKSVTAFMGLYEKQAEV